MSRVTHKSDRASELDRRMSILPDTFHGDQMFALRGGTSPVLADVTSKSDYADALDRRMGLSAQRKLGVRHDRNTLILGVRAEPARPRSVEHRDHGGSDDVDTAAMRAELKAIKKALRELEAKPAKRRSSSRHRHDHMPRRVELRLDVAGFKPIVHDSNEPVQQVLARAQGGSQ